MKNHIQTILNVCFAISITAFIYQNDKQQDSINKLKNDVESNYEIIGLFKQMQDDTNERFIKVMSANEVNIDIAFENIDLAETSRLENRIAIKNMEDYLLNNFGNK